MKNVYRTSIKQHGGIESGVSQSKKLNHLASGACWCTVLLKGVITKLSPQVCENDHFGRFVATMVKLQQLVISETDKVRHGRRAAIQQVCQYRLRQASLYSRHIMMSALHHD